ncbi:hypothetical protein [Thermincola ferriacetica]
MPNFKVFNDEAQDLKTVVYGQYSGTPIPVATDTNGILLTTAYDSTGQPIVMPLTAFKDMRVAGISPEIGWTFNYNINTDLIAVTTTGSGTVTQSNSKAVLQTTAAANSSAKIETKKALRYQPGMGALVRFTALFTSGMANSTQIIGIGDANDGFFFGYNGTSFGILRRQNATDFWIPQSAWNIDKFDGTGLSGITLDPTKGNVYVIQYQWLGFGAIRFFIENPATGDLVPVHVLQYANANTNPSVFNPTLPLMAQVRNTTNTTNIKLETPSAMGFVEGPANNNAIVTRNSVAGSKTGVTTEQAIITIRNNSTFQGKTNRTRIKLDYLSVATDGTKSVTVRLVRNATLGGTPSFTDISTTTSVVSYDTAGTTLTGGTRVLTFEMAKVESIMELLDPLDLYLDPGDTFTVSATSSLSNDVDVALSWRELW